MGLVFRLRTNASATAERVEHVGVMLADPQEVLEAFGEHMREVSFPENFYRGGRPDRWPTSPWTAGHEVMRESGRLLRSVQARTTRGRLELGTNLEYAAQRHFGGELVPQQAKNLAVPVAGLPRSMRRPRRWQDLRFIPAQPGADADTTGVLASQVGRGRRKRWVARFVLRRKVTQPARPWLLFQDEDVVWLNRKIVAAATAAMGAA